MTAPALATGVVHEGDCLSLMAKMPSGSVPLVVTSPPYNLRQTSGHGLDTRGGKWRNVAMRDGYHEYDDCMPHAEYVEWQRACLTDMMRVLNPSGAIFYNHKWRVQNGLQQDRADIVAGFPVRQIIIWHRAGGVNFNDAFFLPDYEVIYLIAHPDFRLARGKNGAGCVWSLPQDQANPHPAPFPLALAIRCIDATGTCGPVLDPFLGSGTTAVAAERCGASWIGIEKSPLYVQMARDRLARARQEPLLTEAR